MQGRAEERRHVERMLANSRRGASSSLLLHGEAGIGKTTLLEHAAAHADGMRVLRVEGIESEMELAFGGLHQLLLPVLDLLDRLPGPQAGVLRASPHPNGTCGRSIASTSTAIRPVCSAAAGSGSLQARPHHVTTP
ncbi:ATP-binding protein [Streptomyces sp. MS1.AVA.4]|uniref:ATP-binding protein n=1 Tax=Streptomyces pratisoli TaxID=3139917 RepID=A0ACC6QTR2_9ACTN